MLLSTLKSELARRVRETSINIYGISGIYTGEGCGETKTTLTKPLIIDVKTNSSETVSSKTAFTLVKHPGRGNISMTITLV